MKESSLHATLKELYAQENGEQEVFVDGYLVDVVQDDLLIEIQTRSFSKIKSKLSFLLMQHHVRLVHPIARDKWIIRLHERGSEQLSRRKSPKHGRIEHLFNELIYISELVKHPNFSLEVVFIEEEELRRNDGRGSWRRRGVSIIDHRLVKVLERNLFYSRRDFRSTIPNDLPNIFTTSDLTQLLGLRPRLARKMAYCLASMHIIERTGKRGNAWLYSISNDN